MGSPVIAHRCSSCSGPLVQVVVAGEGNLVCLRPNCCGHDQAPARDEREGGR
jgi:hypothetical protein